MTVIATDNFNRADGPLGANWTDVYNALAIVSNEVTGGTAADINASWRSAESFPNDQYCKCILTATGQDGGPGVRVSGTNGATFNGYFIESFGGADRVTKFVNGVQTNLFDVDVPYGVGDVLELWAVGTTLTAYRNGVANGSGTDASIASGSAGQWNFSNAGRFNDWEAGSIGGGASPRPRIQMPTIADRAARSMVLVSAITVHTFVGRRVLRGAAQRTKVAVPVVADVKITPPPTRTSVLPHMLKGAPKKVPRPFPDAALTRTPPPRTKSVALPHLLKGAAIRKPTPFPEVSAIRTPAPIARPYLGRHVFPSPPAPVRVIIDPTTTTARMPAPRTRSLVAYAVIQHPTTGSGAPIVSMIEMDAPVTRSSVAHRTTLPPPVPAPSRARPVVALVRSPRPVTETTVGIPKPRLPVVPQSLARPIVVFAKSLRPAVESTVGTPRARSTSTRSLARPVLALIESLRPVTDSFVAVARRVAGPVISRARPIVTRVRMPAPRTESFAGSGVERGPAVSMTLAIGQNNGTVTLRTEHNATVTLTTSE